ncbi:MAG: hypothetical protein E7413_04820 [Ruminococcaceae bacterium]|nr:hypothetical protein [Oscillospiraceae bacterium]
MKKLIAILLSVMLLVTLAACGNKEETKQGGTEATTQEAQDGTAFGIDLAGEGTQPMSEELAEVAVLKKTAEEYLGGNSLFAYSNDERTYADFKEYIGVDASEYQYDAENQYRNYTWVASDDSTAKLVITFAENEGNWTLYAAGSTNLGLAVNQ